MESYDLIIIGSGPGGYSTAATAAASGMKVMICERAELGGTCLNRGCIPTKALCHTATIALQMVQAAKEGLIAPEVPSIDFAAAMQRKAGIVAQLREGVEMTLKDVTIIHGEASFTSPSTVEINGTEYTAPQIIVATGSRPATLDIPGAELAIDSDALLNTTTLPESIVITGAGVIGMEFASILSALGVKTTVVEYCREILPPLDADIAKRLRTILKRRGINIITSATVKAIHPGLTVEYESKGRTSAIDADAVLMAVGRRPVLPAGLTELGVTLDRRGFIEVDSSMRTSIPGIYAVGDVNGRCMLAHAAEAQGRVAIGHPMNLDVIPSAVFTYPECAMAGPTEEQCRNTGLDIITGQATFRANGKAVAMGETDGLIKVIAMRDGARIIACHICGPHAADLIAEPALAIAHGLTAADLLTTIHAHPTLSEVLPRALESMR
ncbi:MAG: dihydrolipoyl dehydrogenase [Muribaculaceae bacterium]|nr:dihydrolipoyl dehydrogenase [Muribaculaceae bacterium]